MIRLWTDTSPNSSLSVEGLKPTMSGLDGEIVNTFPWPSTGSATGVGAGIGSGAGCVGLGAIGCGAS